MIRSCQRVEKRSSHGACINLLRTPHAPHRCSQTQFIIPACKEARCVDADRLAHVIGSGIKACLKGNRKECGCFESREIAEYDTCPHGYVYCYADLIAYQIFYSPAFNDSINSKSLFISPSESCHQSVDQILCILHPNPSRIF